MPDAEPLVAEHELARPYETPSYADPADAVDDYRRVMSHSSRHPNKGSSAVASTFDLPRGRVRPWLDGGAPDAVRGLETAREYGWLETSYGEPVFEGLNRLVANVFSAGSIAAQNYAPSFALTNGDDSHVFDALKLAGIEYTVVGDRDGRADEARPTDDGTVLGRVLSVLGAPVGPKAEQRLSLPDYLADAPTDVRAQFVRAYLENRAHEHNNILKLREERNRSYLDSLAALIEDVADGSVTVSEKNLIISKQATDNLATVR